MVGAGHNSSLSLSIYVRPASLLAVVEASSAASRRADTWVLNTRLAKDAVQLRGYVDLARGSALRWSRVECVWPVVGAGHNSGLSLYLA